MEFSLLSILFLGLILGIKHALEPDHVIAVSTIVSKNKKLWHSSLSGMFWGIGHTITLFIFGMIFILMKKQISKGWVMSLEFIVGIMLVYLGVNGLLFYDSKNIHLYKHNHDHNNFSYIKSLVIGSIHGLAGSGAMILLTMTTVSNPLEGSVYILIFGIGTVIGMLLCTTLIGVPFVMSSKNHKTNVILTKIAGGISTIFGFYYMYNLGVNEGLFKIWINRI